MSTQRRQLLAKIGALSDEERSLILGELLAREAARAEVLGARHEVLHLVAALEALEGGHEPTSCPLLAATLDPRVLAHRLELLSSVSNE